MGALKTRDWKRRDRTAGLENARTDWLWKADQAYRADTLPNVNLRRMTAADSGSKANQRQWN